MILLNPLINLWKYYTNPISNFIYCTTVGLGYSFRLCTCEPLIHMPFRVMLKPKKVVILWRKLLFLILQQNTYIYKCVKALSRSLKCFFHYIAIDKYVIQKDHYYLLQYIHSQIIYCVYNISGALVKLISITAHSLSLY